VFLRRQRSNWLKPRKV